ncbi:putative lipoprotein YerB [Sporosarcina sp. NCCP-2222]|nr:putative lipoprotein YerB [Sporosarcina sp. NCCP-2222]
MMKGKKRIWLLFMAAFMLLIVSACSKKDKVEAEQPEPSDIEEEVIQEEEAVDEPDEDAEGALLYQSPFTGELQEEKQWRRPILATINNHPLARPQSGISEADMIFEFLAEGNVTRYLALFQSELPEQVGPIRSARDYFIYMAKGMDAFYIAHGYSPDAQKLLTSRYVDHINGMQYDGTLFKRSKERRAPHNSYISGEHIVEAMDKMSGHESIEKMPSLAFHDSVESAKIGDTASELVVRFSTNQDFISTFTYQPEEGTYKRSVKGTVTIDKENGEQIEVSNVLVFEAPHRTIDSVGRQAVDLEAGGKAILFQAGIVKEIEWKNIDGFLTPVENGVPVELVPGKTWINIIPTTSGIAKAVTYTP